MSHRYGSSSSRDSRSYSSSRRESPPRHHRSSDRSRRSPSPGPSRSRREEPPPAPRDPKSLPEAFGRGFDVKPVEDDSNILQRMKTHYINSPLSDLYACIKEGKKVKIWTRNFKEVRGVMTGYLIAFDKHWNLVLKDVDEVFLKPKKSKTPFLRELAANEALVDIPAKVPREKKAAATAQPEPAAPQEGAEAKKKKTRRKKAKSTSAKRQIPQLFVRGDNIVMVCPMEDNPEEEEEEEMEGEEVEEGEDNRKV